MDSIQTYEAATVVAVSVCTDIKQLLTKAKLCTRADWAGWQVLGRIVEVIGGQTLGQFLKQRIFVPLSMCDTRFTVSEQTAPRFCDIYMRKGQRPGAE